MQEKMLHLNDTADVQFQELIKDILMDTGRLSTFTVSSIITECLPRMSFSCAQKKFLVLLNRLGRVERIGLMGDSVSIVRTVQVNSTLAEDSGLRERLSTVKDQEEVLGYLVDHSAEIYLDSHVIRLKLPSWIRAEVGGSGETTALDFGLENPAIEEGKRRNENSDADEYGVALHLSI
jgi:hypothetical protein